MASSVTPFPHQDIFMYTMSFVGELEDFNAASVVCKEWNQFAKDLNTEQYLWKGFFAKKGIPMVQKGQGEIRNYRKDFCAIYRATTVSG